MLIAPPIAAAQDRTPTPSAEELWRTYPLHPSPEPATPTPAELERTASAPRAQAGGGGSGGGEIVPLVGGAAALILAGAAAVVLHRRQGRRRIPGGIEWAAPLVPVAAAAALPPSGRA